MEHTDAIREMMTERYLLDELTPEVREDFEEHFFSCLECARDVKAGFAVIENSKILFSAAEESKAEVNRAAQVKPGWLTWLVPAFAIPALAILLLVIGYQNLVQYPRLKESIAGLQTPEILPSISLATNRDANIPSIRVHRNESFLLFLDIPAESQFKSYKAELQDSAGTVEWTLMIPGDAAKDTLSIRVPPGNVAGLNNLVLYGLNSGGESGTELRRYRFHLDYQQ